MKKADLYQEIDIRARVESASPYELISLLYEGLLTSLTATRRAMEQGDLTAKSHHVTRSLAILNALIDSLDDSVDSDFPHNIRRLYNYMIERNLQASRDLDVAAVNEVIELLLTIKSGWDAIDPGKS